MMHRDRELYQAVAKMLGIEDRRVTKLVLTLEHNNLATVEITRYTDDYASTEDGEDLIELRGAFDLVPRQESPSDA